jgi:hypothetical protein
VKAGFIGFFLLAQGKSAYTTFGRPHSEPVIQQQHWHFGMVVDLVSACYLYICSIVPLFQNKVIEEEIYKKRK